MATQPLAPFTRFARATSRLAGRPTTFALAAALVLAWAASGPFFGYSEAWQLTINTLTTIATFLMVFLIQATQNRDAEAIQIKLDELILAIDGAHNEIIDSEDLEEDEQLELHRKYLAAAAHARELRSEVVKVSRDASDRKRRAAD
jgi:low affinity Fe/Cu permease